MYDLKELCFEITNYCYQNCIYCSSFDNQIRKPSQIHIPFDTIKNVIDQFCNLGGQILELSGGEPLAHPQILNIVDYALNKKLDVIIYTSGILPEQYNIQNILKELKTIGLNKIVFNCQGLGKTHDVLVQKKKSFVELTRVIEISKEFDYWIGAHFVPTKINFTQIRQVFYYLHELKVNQLSILRLVKQGRAKANWSKLELNYREYLYFFDILIRLMQENIDLPNIRLGCPFNCIKVLHNWNLHCECHAGKSSLDIMTNGNVIPCPAFKDIPNAKIGNIFDNSLEIIWNRSSFLKLLRDIKVSEISFCCDCEFADMCKGCCSAQRLISNNSLIVGPDPICVLIAFKKEVIDA